MTRRKRQLSHAAEDRIIDKLERNLKSVSPPEAIYLAGCIRTILIEDTKTGREGFTSYELAHVLFKDIDDSNEEGYIAAVEDAIYFLHINQEELRKAGMT